MTDSLTPEESEHFEVWKKGLLDEYLHLSQIENPELNNEYIRVEGVISSTSISYYTPKLVNATWWDDEGLRFNEERLIPIHSIDNAKFVGISEGRKHKLLKSIMNVPQNANIEILSNRLTYRLRLRPPVFRLHTRGDRIIDELGHEYKPYDVYIVSETKLDLKASTKVIIMGKSFPDPKNQKTTLLGVEVDFPDSIKIFDKEKLGKLLLKFAQLTIRERVEWILHNFEIYSRIVGRRNFAFASFLGYFTPIWIEFNGDRQRGWGIILIIGDTTCGKSATIDKRARAFVVKRFLLCNKTVVCARIVTIIFSLVGIKTMG